MASSDEEEGKILSQYVSDYHFAAGEDDTPVSFSILPVQWDGKRKDLDSDTNEKKKTLALLGNCDDGRRPVYFHVTAWRFELSYVNPEIHVLTKERKWVTLQKPRKAFEPFIRTILVSVHWLHFAKKNPDASQASAWKHLQTTCSSYCAQPSVNDLLEHTALIMEAADRDKDIKESKSFLTFAGESQADITFDQDAEATKHSDGKQNEIFDHVCAICDDGGEILNCSGRCLRSFHPTVADGVDAKCESLGFRNKAEYEAIPIFMCKNCIHKQHQCFVCGRLGSSAISSGQEVFPCASAICGHFYHPVCVARLLHADNETQAEELREKIIAGESFTCPAHKCFSCKKHEIAHDYELQFAICRRCPKAFHRKCLPRTYVFYHQKDENTLARAWENLLPNNRILIYCMEHKIIPLLETPERNHLIFPSAERTHNSELIAGQDTSASSKRTKDFGGFALNRSIVKKPKLGDKLQNDVEIFYSSAKERCFLQDSKSLKKVSTIDPAKRSLNKISSVPTKPSIADKGKLLLKDNLGVNLGSSLLDYKEQKFASNKIKSTIPEKPAMQKGKMSLPLPDAEIKKRIATLMEDVSSSFDVEEFKRRKVPATHFHSKNKMEKAIPLGLVETYVKSVQTALQKLEVGSSIADAQIICSPDNLSQLFDWKKKLKVYLAPFFHGARYTSFGRHFTQAEKLKEIVDRIQWYVQDGDMIVDFCCGSNDFSCFLKQQLEKNGKSCSFRNYDIIQAKNDFNFERRDWLKFDRNELPVDGSRLIMGLNPPFGVNASLANKFINKALEFAPKLIVLIVPKETKRLDDKASYDLVWEDDQLLSGKSFYLPGSVDVNDKQMDQWNSNPPPLYLWSRGDWTERHIAIAAERGHLSYQQDNNVY